MRCFERQLGGLWGPLQISVMMKILPTIQESTVLQALAKLREPLHSSTHCRLGLQALQDSPVQWMQLQTRSQGTVRFHLRLQVRVLVLGSHDLKRWSVTCLRGEAMFLIQACGITCTMVMKFRTKVQAKKLTEGQTSGDLSKPCYKRCSSLAMSAMHEHVWKKRRLSLRLMRVSVGVATFTLRKLECFIATLSHNSQRVCKKWHITRMPQRHLVQHCSLDFSILDCTVLAKDAYRGGVKPIYPVCIPAPIAYIQLLL